MLFDERIVYSQCQHCNGNPPFGLGGNYVEYFMFMLEEWGLFMIDEFRALKHETKVYKEYQFRELEAEFKEKTKRLLDNL